MCTALGCTVPLITASGTISHRFITKSLVRPNVLSHSSPSKFSGLCPILAGLGIVDRSLSPAVLGIHVRHRIIAPVSPLCRIFLVMAWVGCALLHVSELKLTNFCQKNRRQHIKTDSQEGDPVGILCYSFTCIASRNRILNDVSFSHKAECAAQVRRSD
jgi:hypothetical protein